MFDYICHCVETCNSNSDCPQERPYCNAGFCSGNQSNIIHIAAILDVIESPPSSFTLCLYNHYLLQNVIAWNIDVVTGSASQPAIDVTNMMIVVITATNKTVVCIS